MARTWMDMHRLRRLHDSQYIMKNPFTNENSNLSNIFHNNIHRKKVESLKVRSTEEFLCQFAWLPCRFFRGRRQGRQPLNKIYKTLQFQLFLEIQRWDLDLQKSTEPLPPDVPSVSQPGGIKFVDLPIAQVTVSHLKPTAWKSAVLLGGIPRRYNGDIPYGYCLVNQLDTVTSWDVQHPRVVIPWKNPGDGILMIMPNISQ